MADKFQIVIQTVIIYIDVCGNDNIEIYKLKNDLLNFIHFLFKA